MSARYRSGLRLVLAFAIVLIAGCASPTRARDPNAGHPTHWQGRLSLKVDSTPVQAFSADFDLQGDAVVGSLSFFSPLGSTLARLQWGTGGAQLQTTGEPQHFESLDALTRHTTGAVLPVASLFEWLKGSSPPTPGWEVDLRALSDGRLTAQRVEPETPAQLKIILDR
ncbi:MAG: lipoprotein insertase outer membrane protein LolB [Rhodoferax sp.]|nr:lipoprotein insertase outer membrane protein LolB [Rhodoferax sp.]